MFNSTLSIVKLAWIKCYDDSWCSLTTVNLDHEHFRTMEGVYIIWHGGNNPTTVRVGQGIIKDRLKEHREDKKILAYEKYGLYTTWARVSTNQQNGVERFLAESLQPLVGTRFPSDYPIAVNLPW